MPPWAGSLSRFILPLPVRDFRLMCYALSILSALGTKKRFKLHAQRIGDIEQCFRRGDLVLTALQCPYRRPTDAAFTGKLVLCNALRLSDFLDSVPQAFSLPSLGSIMALYA